MHEVSGARDRDRARAVRRVHPGRVPGRHRGPALQAVRGHGRGRGGDLRLHGAHAHAGAVRAAAQGRRPRVAALPAVQRRLREGHATFPVRRGPRARAHAWSRASLSSCCSRSWRSSSGACRRASCRPRTRATSSARSSCPTRRRCSAPPEDRRAAPAAARERPRSIDHMFVAPGRDFIGGANKTERRHDASCCSSTGTSARRPRRSSPPTSRAGHELRRRHGDRVQSAGDPRPGHRGRLRVLRAVARRVRSARVSRRCRAGVHRRAREGSASCRASTRSSARRCRSCASR